MSGLKNYLTMQLHGGHQRHKSQNKWNNFVKSAHPLIGNPQDKLYYMEPTIMAG